MTVAGLLAGAAAVTAVVAIARIVWRRTTPVRGARKRWRAIRIPGRRRTPGAVSDREMAAWCEHAARGLRAGGSLSTAIGAAGAAAPGPGQVMLPAVDALHRGLSMAAALERLVPVAGTPQAVVTPVLRACVELGGQAAGPLDRVAANLHARADADAERVAHSAQARLSAQVLTVLPIGVFSLMALGEPSIRAASMSPIGLACILSGGALNLAGWWWMRRLIGTSGRGRAVAR